MKDFDWLVKKIRAKGMEVALDFAINCSPDHPYVKDHPDWFYQRPDGTIKYAENPPKRYEDIYPLNFHCDDWEALWQEMKSIIGVFWCARGRAYLPGGQPAHEARRVLGLDDRGCAGRVSRTQFFSPRRSPSRR